MTGAWAKFVVPNKSGRGAMAFGAAALKVGDAILSPLDLAICTWPPWFSSVPAGSSPVKDGHRVSMAKEQLDKRTAAPKIAPYDFLNAILQTPLINIPVYDANTSGFLSSFGFSPIVSALRAILVSSSPIQISRIGCYIPAVDAAFNRLQLTCITGA